MMGIWKRAHGLPVLFLLLLSIICLTGCGSVHAITRKNEDGSVAKIKYKNAVPFERAPYFTTEGTDLCMTFNGNILYRVSIIDKETAGRIAEGTLLAESSNMKVYEGRETEEIEACQYAYVLQLDGTDDAFILFYTFKSPYEGGSDFTTSIEYSVGKAFTVPDMKFTILVEERSPAEEEVLPEDLFEELVCGAYCYDTVEDKKEYFEVSRIDGLFFAEHESIYGDLTGAELEVLSAEKSSDGFDEEATSFTVKIYPFSGFSFAGEYWGAGWGAVWTILSDGTFELSSGDPFFSGEEAVTLTWISDGSVIHPDTLEKRKDTVGEVLHGAWRYVGEEDGVPFEEYMEFSEDGTFRYVRKYDTYPVWNYRGTYQTDLTDGKLSGVIFCERFACGGEPEEWIFIYDAEAGLPVFGDAVKSFERTEPGKRILEIRPGPGTRSDEVETKWQEWILLWDSEGEDVGEPAETMKNLDDAIYVGEYSDVEWGSSEYEPDLVISRRADGKYGVEVGIFRLTTLHDGVGELTSEGMVFTATDAAGNPIRGVIMVEDQMATVTFTDSTWAYIRNGDAYQFNKR